MFKTPLIIAVQPFTKWEYQHLDDFPPETYFGCICDCSDGKPNTSCPYCLGSGQMLFKKYVEHIQDIAKKYGIIPFSKVELKQP